LAIVRNERSKSRIGRFISEIKKNPVNEIGGRVSPKARLEHFGEVKNVLFLQGFESRIF
jgi:hypothetical protein